MRLSTLRETTGTTVVHERNLGRAPLWHAKEPCAGLVAAPSVLYGREFRQVAGRPLTVADQRLLAELSTQWLTSGAPGSGRVQFSLGDGVRALGHRVAGGEQRRTVRAALQRLAACRLHSRVRHGDGHESDWNWGFVSSFGTTTRGGGRGVVVLSEELRQLLLGSSTTYVERCISDATAHDDDVAWRLWVFLETEQFTLGRTWRYRLFDCDPVRSIPPVAELLCLSHWAARKKVAHRLRAACRVIEQNDPRYRVGVVSTVSGEWHLEVSKSAGAGRRSAGQLPDGIVAAWRGLYRQRVPSARQAAVVRELLSRHPEVDIVRMLRSAGSRDPFRHLLAEDRRHTRSRLDAARRADEEWAASKAREIAGAERLGDLLQGLMPAVRPMDPAGGRVAARAG